MWKFEIYKDQDDGWRWRFVLRNAVIVESSELFARRVDAKQAVEGARIEIDRTVIDVVTRAARRTAGMPTQAVAVHEDAVHAIAVHAELRADVARWNALPLVGFQLYGEAGVKDGVVLELRNCMCGSTLGRRVSARADLIVRLHALTEALAHMPPEA